MNRFEQIEVENQKIVSDMKQLAGTEDSRLSVVSAVFVRLNNEMRFKNIQDVKKDISYGAKDFRQPPEKYVVSMDSIIRSYIQEINEFMKFYNDEFMNIQNIVKNAEEKQKYYFFKIREMIVMKNICELAEKSKEEYQELDEYIKQYRKKLGIYEKIIMRCDKEFEDCKNRREQDFKELFSVTQEQALMVVKKSNVFEKLIKKITSRFNGYEKFSRFFLQKHAARINRMKTETINTYSTKIKQSILGFSEEINGMLEGV